jgi:DNA-binding FadR family transcriptional regulator
MNLAKVQRGSLVDAVIGSLRDAVESKRWPVNERIPTESALAEQLGVGRNTVREAVRVLVHIGMLETRQGDGTYVRVQFDPGETMRRVDRAGLRDRIEVRLTLEVEAARLAATRRDNADLTGMRDALEARAAAGGDLCLRIDADERFHHAVVASAYNSALTHLYRYFARAIRNTIERTEVDLDLPEPSQADHEALLNAIDSGCADTAETAARQLLTPSLAALHAEN